MVTSEGKKSGIAFKLGGPHWESVYVSYFNDLLSYFSTEIFKVVYGLNRSKI